MGIKVFIVTQRDGKRWNVVADSFADAFRKACGELGEESIECVSRYSEDRT